MQVRLFSITMLSVFALSSCGESLPEVNEANCTNIEVMMKVEKIKSEKRRTEFVMKCIDVLNEQREKENIKPAIK
ncbi:MAG: entry exclusion lipoprotein TrbK [Betaproteobacteria bacterium]|nr:entry exclusion lipoprotein TrbK [Betaproteobacteria bacterium]